MPLLLLNLFCTFSVARADFQVPALSGPVVDQAGVLSSSTRETLDQFLRNFHDRGGAQIQVTTVPDLGGLSIEEASIKITDQWKLGKKKEDRGVMLLLAMNDHKVRIEVGQGLEGDIPDAIASRIVNDVIIPRMREGSTDRAVIDGVLAIAHYTDKDLLDQMNTGVPSRSHSTHGGSRFITILWWLFILFMFLSPIFSHRRRGPFWWGGFGGWGGGFGGGGFGGGGFGGGGFGGGGGGGWSGGGGGFSGGGASGGW